MSDKHEVDVGESSIPDGLARRARRDQGEQFILERRRPLHNRMLGLQGDALRARSFAALRMTQEATSLTCRSERKAGEGPIL